MEKRLMVFTDFDGTISQQDICYSMVKTFAGGGWEEINRLWEEGILSTGECAQRTLDMMDVKPAELRTFFQAKEIDAGFPVFIDWLKNKNYPVYIVSDGYDNYIELLLTRHGLDIEYYANHLEYENGWNIRSPYINPECGKCGVCKCGIIKEKSSPEFTTVYIGDGYSDLCPVKICDIVFAQKSLAEYCRREGIAFYPYRDFNDVSQQIQKITENKRGDFNDGL